MLIECSLFVFGFISYCLIICPLIDYLDIWFFSDSRIGLTNLTSKQKDELICKILDWSIINIQMNRKRQTKPVLFISKRKKTKYLGNYQFNNKRITIYILKHSSIEELCNTIIHEYVHHLQLRSIKDDIRYNKLTKQKSVDSRKMKTVQF